MACSSQDGPRVAGKDTYLFDCPLYPITEGRWAGSIAQSMLLLVVASAVTAASAVVVVAAAAATAAASAAVTVV